LDRAEERGTNAEEIREVIETGTPVQAERGRLGKAKIYPFNRQRLWKFYEQSTNLVAVTVYVFYGQWEGQG
jgi:hypothetical protein